MSRCRLTFGQFHQPTGPKLSVDGLRAGREGGLGGWIEQSAAAAGLQKTQRDESELTLAIKSKGERASGASCLQSKHLVVESDGVRPENWRGERHREEKRKDLGGENALDGQPRKKASSQRVSKIQCFGQFLEDLTSTETEKTRRNGSLVPSVFSSNIKSAVDGSGRRLGGEGHAPEEREKRRAMFG